VIHFADDEVEALLRGPLALPPFVEALRKQTIVEPPPPVDPSAEAHRVAAEVEELRQKLVDLSVRVPTSGSCRWTNSWSRTKPREAADHPVYESRARRCRATAAEAYGNRAGGRVHAV
jgi:hypothetical protein